MTSNPFDVEATNPRYKGLKMSDMARILLRPKDPVVRAAVETLQTKTDDGEEPQAVKHPL